MAKSNKRSHSESTAGNPTGPTSSKLQQSRKRFRHTRADAPVIKLDRLRWKKVDMPDRLDDAEGFFGLEEIDGVDVNIVDGKIEYKLLDPEVEKKEGETEEEEDLGDFAMSGDEADGEGKEYEEWTGFGDDEEDKVEEAAAEETGEEKTESKTETDVPTSTEPAAEPKLSNKERKAKERKEKLDKAKKERKEKKKAEKDAAAAPTAPEDANTNPFALLQDDDDVDIELPDWDRLNLSLPTLRALQKLGFKSPTPIQSASIPKIIAGNDLIGKASTGSGKTLAFGIPILEAYLAKNDEPITLKEEEANANKEKLPLALVMAPTRELAHQLRDHLTALSQFAPDFRIATITGGLSMQKQIRQLERGCDLIIATPGRLWEIVGDGRGWIDKLRRGLRFLVVDEADRLLQEGHFKEVEEVLNLLNKPEDEDSDVEEEPVNGIPSMEDVEDNEMKKPKSKKRKGKAIKRQILVFSATFQKELQHKLAGKGNKTWKDDLARDEMEGHESMEWLLKRLNFGDVLPKFVDVNPASQMASGLREGIVECGAMEKDLYLYYLLLRYPCRTLVFTNSISSVKRLSPMLAELQLPSNPLHSNMIQKARLRNLERFASAESPNSILVATDVAARGLDIKGVEMVIHYHVPRTADMYVHRSGRTARAEDRGLSVLLCAPDELQGVRRLVSKVHDKVANRDSRGRYSIKSFGVDRDLAKRLKPRLNLAKKIADSTVEKIKKGKEADWLKNAAEELGVDYESEEFEGKNVGKKGVRGKAKRDKAASATKGNVQAWKGELKAMLKTKVNAGFSTRYLTSGTVNIAQAMLDGMEMHENIMGLEKRNVVDEHL